MSLIGPPIFDEDGKVRRIAGMAEDITERMSTEKSLKEYGDKLSEDEKQKIEQELDEAVEFAKKSPLPEAASLYDNLYV